MTLTETINERPMTGSPTERFTSRNPADFPEPSRREELWRFSPLTTLRTLFNAAPSDARLARSGELPEGVELLELDKDDPTLADAPQPVDRLSALAYDRAAKATVLRIAKGVEIAEPIVIKLIGSGSDEVVWSRLVVDARAHSSATIVVEYTGCARVAAETSVLVGDGAHLSLVHVHSWDAGTLHNEHVGALLGRDASYRYTTVSLGGDVVRIAPTVNLAGPGSRAELLGVAFAGSGQHFESRLYVDHSAPQCTSDVLSKHALLGETARTVWIGDVRIRPSAIGTTTYEMNRNLLLSHGARADSVPNLEIETGEIASAGHASTTGRFDDLQLFYLQSRGIEHDQAQRLVVRGFFADVVERIGVPALEEQIMTAIEARLGFTASVTDDIEDTEEVSA
ncbi:MAG: Fe-S cluster assembly protein SufD [Jatrophihabitantaceae bacterium]